LQNGLKLMLHECRLSIESIFDVKSNSFARPCFIGPASRKKNLR